jgi:hypothetical protein
VFTGILPVCQDEEGLAAVVAHGMTCLPLTLNAKLQRATEIGHVGMFRSL